MKPFTIPLQSQVRAYMAERKPEWPGSFLTWYSEKFWNHYQACGWKLSGNKSMKDWQAAFNSNWKELKWDAAAKLIECQKTEPKLTGSVWLDYQARQIDWKGLAAHYKAFVEKMRLCFTREEWDKLVADAGNDKEWGRFLSMKLYFTKYDKSGNDIVARPQTT